MDLIVYLTTRLEALELLVRIHNAQTGDYLVMERAICTLQLEKLQLKIREELHKSKNTL